jgi:hypothetical protein
MRFFILSCHLFPVVLANWGTHVSHSDIPTSLHQGHLRSTSAPLCSSIITSRIDPWHLTQMISPRPPRCSGTS